jgi:drug/metabolite transporter (DMT)-like permease
VAATGVVVPVGIGLASGESPELVQLVGIALAVVGVVLACGPGGGSADGPATLRPLLLSAVAALGFGTTLVLVAEGAEHSVVMTLATMRAANAAVATLVLAVAVRRATHPRRDDVPTLALIGVTDAGANGAYALASTMSLVSVSAVLASLYPAVTALLAWRFHREQLTAVQVGGVVATLGGVGLIAAGSA